MAKTTKAPKTYTVRVTKVRCFGKGTEREYTGTLEELANEVFGYTLEVGHSHNSRISRNPRTAKGLVSALQRSSDIMYGATYTREFYELV